LDGRNAFLIEQQIAAGNLILEERYMKARLFLTTLFGIMLFAVSGNAQSLVRFNTHSIGPSVSPSSSGEIPTIDAVSGKPIRVVIDFVKSGKSTPALLLSPSKGVTFKNIPCGPGERILVSNRTVQVYLEIELENALISSYSISGHAGSCRLLSVRLADGNQYGAKLRFRE
jgi:hypothetical protein